METSYFIYLSFLLGMLIGFLVNWFIASRHDRQIDKFINRTLEEYRAYIRELEDELGKWGKNFSK